MATHSSVLPWRIPGTEEPGGPQSMGSLRVGQDSTTSLSLFTLMHWRRKWQPTPVFFPGESQGRGSLVGCPLWGRTESDTTEATQQLQQTHGSWRQCETTQIYMVKPTDIHLSLPQQLLSTCQVLSIALGDKSVVVTTLHILLGNFQSGGRYHKTNRKMQCCIFDNQLKYFFTKNPIQGPKQIEKMNKK